MNQFFVVREACPCCNSASNQTIYKNEFLDNKIKDYLDDFYNGRVEWGFLVGCDYILDECLDCGAVFQREIPNDDLMCRLYEQWIDPAFALDKRRKLGINSYVADANRLLDVITYFSPLPNRPLTFLDFGMGWGDWCRLASSLGCDTYGTELSPSRIAYAKQFGVKVISWDEIPSLQFDYIHAEQVFEHIPNPLNTLFYLVMALRPGGLLKFSVPSGGWDVKRKLMVENWKAPKGSIDSLNVVAPLEHINCFTYRTIEHISLLVKLTPVEIVNRHNAISLKSRVKNTLNRVLFDRRGLKRGTSVYLMKPRNA